MDAPSGSKFNKLRRRKVVDLKRIYSGEERDVVKYIARAKIINTLTSLPPSWLLVLLRVEPVSQSSLRHSLLQQIDRIPINSKAFTCAVA
jgi:hypothetical protein